MHKKVNIGIALGIILIIAGIFAWIISVQAQALGTGLSFSGSASSIYSRTGTAIQIERFPVKCVYDPVPLSTCLETCSVCGSLAGVCGGLWEVPAITIGGGIDTLYYGAGGGALCLSSPYVPSGGFFIPGAQCIGNVLGFGPHTLFNFGCG